MFITVFLGAIILFLLILGSIFCKDITDNITGETQVDHEGRVIGYSIFALAFLIFFLTFIYIK